MFQVYILYSTAKDKYYVGHTGEVLEERLRKHNSKHKEFTGSKADWEIKYTEKFMTKSEAYRREVEIKNRKSRKYIEQLISSADSGIPLKTGGSGVRIRITTFGVIPQLPLKKVHNQSGLFLCPMFKVYLNINFMSFYKF